METKKAWQSKSIVINSVVGLCAALALFVPGLSGASEFVAAHAAEIGVGWSVLNIVLRLVTKDKIALGD